MLDPEFEAALAPVFDDLIASAGLLLDARARVPHPLSQSVPGFLYATVWTPDGSAVDVAIQAGWPRAGQVVDLAAQMQEIAIEARWSAQMPATWPECSAHPNSHPLEPALIAECAVWRCPVSGDTLFEIGNIPSDHEEQPDLDATEYEALTGISKSEYEQRIFHASEQILVGPHLDGVVESVTLGVGDAPTLDVVVRANHVPGRRFGWRIPVWPAPSPSPPYTDTIEGYVGLFPVYLMEFINSLPGAAVGARIDADGVEWIDDTW